MRAIFGFKLVRYGALMSLSYDKRQVFLFAEHISVKRMPHTLPDHVPFFPHGICQITNIFIIQRKIVLTNQRYCARTADGFFRIGAAGFGFGTSDPG